MKFWKISLRLAPAMFRPVPGCLSRPFVADRRLLDVSGLVGVIPRGAIVFWGRG